ncbi:MAG TPA: secretin N-terminal domain-containing protein [Mariprofundaceae bacterium]|nr:secretin N-terminal domain-containing protein [Mariprofundaceae bacterium]
MVQAIKNAFYLCALLVLLAGVLVQGAQAQTEVISIVHLPLAEAENAVRSQLSGQGTVVSMPSRRILVVSDDAAHLRKVRELLSRLDQPLARFRAMIEIKTRQSRSVRGLSVSGVVSLPGGWVQIRLDDQSSRNASMRNYQLQVSGSRPGRIEAGRIYMLPGTRMWLKGIGIVESATQVPVTGGFNIIVQPSGEDMAHVRIRPWLQQLGGAGEQQRIDVLGAATELTVPLDRDITIASVSGDAQEMGRALLSGRSQTGSQDMVIRLRIHRF